MYVLLLSLPIWDSSYRELFPESVTTKSDAEGFPQILDLAFARPVRLTLRVMLSRIALSSFSSGRTAEDHTLEKPTY